MPDLDFTVLGADTVPYAVTPTIAFHLRVKTAPGQLVKGIALECQVRIDAQLRRYADDEKAALYDLFGDPPRWGQTLKSLLWTMANVNVPPFTDEVVVDLLVPCTYDFNIIAAKYFHGVREGIVPLDLLFSGTVFYDHEDGGLQIQRISWTKEATFDFPVQTWKDLMQMYYPNTAWLALRQDIYDRLNDFKSRRGLPTFEAALEGLLQEQEARA